MVSLADYNLFLEEDSTVNRLHESIDMLDEIMNSRWFSEVTIIIFLNQYDVFLEKIKRIPLTVCYPECTDGKHEADR